MNHLLNRSPSRIVPEVMKVSLFLIAILFALGAQTFAQKTPPAENASAGELHKWISTALTKYGSYKTRTGAVDISNVRFDGCTIKYTVTQKSGSTSTAVMGATRTMNTLKNEVSIDLPLLSSGGVKLSDHVYPDLQTIEMVLKKTGVSGLADDRVIELAVKREAGDAIRSALLRAARGCSGQN
jgi:hypothetical protein